MIEFSGRGILLDIEGTTSSVSYVYDVMFPFARRELEAYLRENWGGGDLAAVCDLIARDAGQRSLADWSGEQSDDEARRELVQNEVIRLMDSDVKATGLKQLQGLIWKSGFESGELKSQVYDDVPPALKAWNEAGCDVRIYSSGSIAAQKLFFGHTIVGNLLDCFRGHYDTATGSKKESASYSKIALEFGLSPDQLLFVSDIPAELDAARDARFETALCRRPGNAEVSADHGHPEIKSFDEINRF